MPAPDFVLIGHVTRDLLPDGRWRLGGTVTYAAVTAWRLGWHPAIVSSAPADVLAALAALLPEAALAVTPARDATTFCNAYHGGIRRQVVSARAAPLGLDAVPDAWRAAPVILLAPVAREVDPLLAASLPAARLRAATAQGWLRAWDAQGAIMSAPLGAAEVALAHLEALFVSREDLLAPGERDVAAISAAERELARWAARGPLVVVTEGRVGARLLARVGPERRAPAYAVREVDPTGAGDVFAAAFLCALGEGAMPAGAADFANRVAGLAIEREGVAGIPTRAEVAARFPS